MIQNNDYWIEQYKDRPDLEKTHLVTLEKMAKDDPTFHLFGYLNAGWLSVAILHNNEIVIDKILNHINVPSDGLTLKERIAYYQLSYKE